MIGAELVSEASDRLLPLMILIGIPGFSYELEQDVPASEDMIGRGSSESPAVAPLVTYCRRIRDWLSFLHRLTEIKLTGCGLRPRWEIRDISVLTR